MMERFPNSTNSKSDNNAAIKLFGRRFYKDQTPVEYLAEFLLVFASSKVVDGSNKYQFPQIASGTTDIKYWPHDRLPLKFFSFFASSKLETRYEVHSDEFRSAIKAMKSQINAGSEQKCDLTVRLLQSLFSGFVGVAKNRTWATQAFLPASDCLLAREIDWRHTQAIKNKPTDWVSTLQYFDSNTHNFMARGGELIYLQLLNLFSHFNSQEIAAIKSNKSYKHLTDDLHWKDEIETNLKEMLSKVENHIGGLASFIEECWKDFRLTPEIKPSSLGWVPKDTATEAYLLASEIGNIASSSHGSLQKVEFLQNLCCLHVLRTLCCRARRLGADDGETDGFISNYTWIVCARDSETAGEGRKLAIEGYQKIEQMLYRVLRIPQFKSASANFTPAQGDDHVYKLFRKLGKEIGLLSPKTGKSIRFVLPNSIIRLLVAALIKPGERIRLSEFYSRIFAHYGIAIRSAELSVALNWLGNPNSVVAMAQNTSWFEEELQRGGFLITLSDAVSIVWNRYK